MVELIVYSVIGVAAVGGGLAVVGISRSKKKQAAGADTQEGSGWREGVADSAMEQRLAEVAARRLKLNNVPAQLADSPFLVAPESLIFDASTTSDVADTPAENPTAGGDANNAVPPQLAASPFLAPPADVVTTVHPAVATETEQTPDAFDVISAPAAPPRVSWWRRLLRRKKPVADTSDDVFWNTSVTFANPTDPAELLLDPEPAGYTRPDNNVEQAGGHTAVDAPELVVPDDLGDLDTPDIDHSDTPAPATGLRKLWAKLNADMGASKTDRGEVDVSDAPDTDVTATTREALQDDILSEPGDLIGEQAQQQPALVDDYTEPAADHHGLGDDAGSELLVPDDLGDLDTPDIDHSDTPAPATGLRKLLGNHGASDTATTQDPETDDTPETDVMATTLESPDDVDDQPRIPATSKFARLKARFTKNSGPQGTTGGAETWDSWNDPHAFGVETTSPADPAPVVLDGVVDAETPADNTGPLMPVFGLHDTTDAAVPAPLPAGEGRKNRRRKDNKGNKRRRGRNNTESKPVAAPDDSIQYVKAGQQGLQPGDIVDYQRYDLPETIPDRSSPFDSGR